MSINPLLQDQINQLRQDGDPLKGAVASIVEISQYQNVKLEDLDKKVSALEARSERIEGQTTRTNGRVNNHDDILATVDGRIDKAIHDKVITRVAMIEPIVQNIGWMKRALVSSVGALVVFLTLVFSFSATPWGAATFTKKEDKQEIIDAAVLRAVNELSKKDTKTP